MSCQGLGSVTAWAEENVNTLEIRRRFDMSYMLAGWDLEELFLRSAPNFFVSEL